MAVSDRVRLKVHHWLEDTFGPEDADELIGSLLPPPGHEAATKDDVRVLGLELRGEIAVLGADLRRELEKVRGEIYRAVNAQTRWLVGFIAVWSGVVLAAAQWMF